MNITIGSEGIDHGSTGHFPHYTEDLDHVHDHMWSNNQCSGISCKSGQSNSTASHISVMTMRITQINFSIQNWGSNHLCVHSQGIELYGSHRLSCLILPQSLDRSRYHPALLQKGTIWLYRRGIHGHRLLPTRCSRQQIGHVTVFFL